MVGICDSFNPSHGAPFECRVLGVVLDFPYLGQRVGVPARVEARELVRNRSVAGGSIPVVAMAGTCMNSGKATGVALRRDILAMEDAGARNVEIFTDYGIVATTSDNAPDLTRNLLADLDAQRPDVIVFELGDGLLGAYGVEAILKDSEIRDRMTAVVLSANDPVSAWGGIKLLRDEFGIEPTAVTGPATDNQVGIDIILARSRVPAINAMSAGAALGDLLQEAIGLGAGAKEQSA